MNIFETQLRKNKKGFTIIELVVVITIIGILAMIAIPSYSGYRQKVNLSVLEANQHTLNSQLIIYSTAGGNIYRDRDNVRDAIIKLDIGLVNPLNKSDVIISSGSAGAKNDAALVVSTRAVTMNQALANPGNNIWPFNAAESSQNKFVGAIIVHLCSDGYITFIYSEDKELHNPIKRPYTQ